MKHRLSRYEMVEKFLRLIVSNTLSQTKLEEKANLNSVSVRYFINYFEAKGLLIKNIRGYCLTDEGIIFHAKLSLLLQMIDLNDFHPKWL